MNNNTINILKNYHKIYKSTDIQHNYTSHLLTLLSSPFKANFAFHISYHFADLSNIYHLH